MHKKTSSEIRLEKIPETSHALRLGRHVEHDPRSRAFEHANAAAPIRSQTWKRYGGAFDQGALGSCTGNALVGCLNTAPLFRGRIFAEYDAVRIYSKATRIDEFPGSYPPTDTGSSGLAVCKAARIEGLIVAYHHAFSLSSALAALGRGPVIVGVNWYEGFDRPKADGLLALAGESRGGHEVELLGVDVERRRVRGINSWGPKWGPIGGYFEWSWDTLERLLHENGDVTVPIR